MQSTDPQSRLLPACRVLVDGSDLQQEMMNDLVEVTVEQTLHIPSACTMRFRDWDFERNQFRWIDDTTLREGKSVEVKMGWENQVSTVFKGEVTLIEMDAAGHMTPILTIHCVDRGHRLHRKREHQTYQQVTDADIVQQIAGRLGLSAQAEATPVVREWVCQNNQTDFEFLSMLAERNNFRFYVDDRTLHFEKIKAADSPNVQLAWGNDLRSLRTRLTTHGQVAKVTVQGWDEKQKQKIVGQAQSSQATRTARIGVHATGGSNADSALNTSSEEVVVDQPIGSQQEADLLAQSHLDSRETSFIEADCLCEGNPSIKPGQAIEITGASQRLSGNYSPTSVTHTMTPAEGYTTQVAATGKNSNTLLGMLAPEEPHRSNWGGYIVVGLVADNKDPEDLGRIKITYPWLMDETSFWARVVSPMAGKNRGIYFLPEVGDEVLVGLEHGDIHRPYMLGALWSRTDGPVEPNSTAVSNGVVHRIVKTRSGHTLMMDDTSGQELCSLTTQGNHVLMMDDGNKKVEIRTPSGHVITLDDSGSTITIKDNTGDQITIEDSGTVSVKAIAKVQVQAPEIEIKADALVSITGGFVKINS